MPADVRFDREPVTPALLTEALPLLAAHWREIAHYPDIPLDVDESSYLAAEDAGLVRCYTARRLEPLENGAYQAVLVGYALYFVRHNLHYRGSRQATQDVLYLAPDVRGGTGYRFIAWCDTQLAGEGVQATYHHVKERHNFGRLLERQGYELVDLIYAKRLDATPAAAAYTRELAMRAAEDDAFGRRLAEALS